MSTLAELQRRFKAQVLHGDARMNDAIVGNAQADAAARVGVYVEAYRLRLLEVLGKDFPGLRAMTGATRFEQSCSAYIQAHPSRHYNARWYGESLAPFLLATPPWSREPALAEMAALEWDLTLVFDAEDCPSARFADVVALAPEQWPGMVLHLQPGFHRRRLQWNVGAIRLATDRDDAPPALAALDAALEWAIWRKDLNVRYRALDADEACVIAALEKGLSFGELCVALCQWHAEEAVSLRAAQLLKTWVEEQWLRALDSTGNA